MNWANFFFFLFLISIPFGTRYLLYQFTPGFHEYETAFIYLSDITLVLFIIFYFIYRHRLGSGGNFQFSKANPLVTSYLLLVTFLLFSAFSLFFAQNFGLAIYSLTRLFLAILMAFAAAQVLRNREILKKALVILAVLAVIQSALGFLQFARQENLGLQILGESPISLLDGKTSKIVVGDGRLLRAYGTFPHPNVLAAFLLLGLMSLYYFWLRRPSAWRLFSSVKNLLSDLVIGLGIFVVIFGLLITFSRTAWLIGAMLTAALIIYEIFKKDYLVQSIRLAILTTAIAAIMLFNFNEFIFPRAQVLATEPAVIQRLAHNRIATKIIKTKPLGVGIGNQVLYSVKERIYQEFGLEKAWHWQPIHNFYLLIASEIGILGLLVFLIFISRLAWRLIKSAASLEKITSIVLLGSILVFGLFDHFFWTLEQGRLMLWLVIGLVLAATNNFIEKKRLY